MGYTPPPPPPEERHEIAQCEWCGQTCGVDRRGGCIACGAPRAWIRVDLATRSDQTTGLVQCDLPLSEAEFKRIRDAWRRAFSGTKARLLILDDHVDGMRGLLGF